MQASERDALKARHDFQAWAGRSPGPAEGVLRHVTFTGTEVPGFRLAVGRDSKPVWILDR